MRYVYRNSPGRSEDDVSAASSVTSVGSYDEYFSSACSNVSDCDCNEERSKRNYRNYASSTPLRSTSTTKLSFHTAMDTNNTATGSTMPAQSTENQNHRPPYARRWEYGNNENAPLLNSSGPRYLSIGSSTSMTPAELSSKDVLSTYKKFERHVRQEKNKQNSLVTIFSLWNTTMGTSLLTMAWGVERAGLLPALILMVLMGGLCLYTAYLLLRVNKHHGGETCEVPALCRILLGGWAETVAHSFSILVLIGANIVYWILISNFLFFTVNYFTDMANTKSDTSNSTLSCSKLLNNGSLITPAIDSEDSPSYWRIHSTVPVYVALIVYPLLNFKSPTFFTKFTSLGTLSVLYLLLFVLIKGSTWGVNISPTLVQPHAMKDAAVLSGMLALSFYIHNIIITIMNNNRRQDNNGRDLTIAFALVTVTYMLVGAGFYICFPLIKTCIEDNMLNNFEMHDVLTAVARILLLFQVVTVYPLVAFMLRTEAILLLPISQRWKEKRTLTMIINLCIVTICILFACFCPNIGTIIRYTGALSGLVHIFALPALLQIRSLQLRGKLTIWKATLFGCIVAIGALNLVLQFFIDD